MRINTLSAVDDYRGCGAAWAALDNHNEIIALRYMSECPTDRSNQPRWVQSIARTANGLDGLNLPTCSGSTALSKIGKAANSCKDCPTPPRRAAYRPSELLAMARDLIESSDLDQWTAYRAKCRDELAELGRVVSGRCSCYQFVQNN